MRNFKYLTFIMVAAYISSGCSTKGDDLCIFETKHIQSKLSDEQVPRYFSVPIDYTDSQAAVIQLVKDRNKPYSSRINSGLADGGVVNLVVEGPCLNNLCNKKDLGEFCKTNQRTALNDKKLIQKLKTSYIRENGIDITFPKKENIHLQNA